MELAKRLCRGLNFSDYSQEGFRTRPERPEQRTLKREPMARVRAKSYTDYGVEAFGVADCFKNTTG
jgi:hypothetical protein